jgi:hypothetical protein
MLARTPPCTTKEINKKWSFSASPILVPPSGIRLSLSLSKEHFHLCRSGIGCVRRYSGRTDWKTRHCRFCGLALLSAVLFVQPANWRNPVPPSPRRETPAQSPFFLVPKVARASSRPLLCCLVC